MDIQMESTGLPNGQITIDEVTTSSWPHSWTRNNKN